MIEGNNFGEKLLGTIKERHILPKPKWQFLLKDYMIWAIGAVALLIGAIATCLVIYMLDADDLDIYKKIDNGLSEFILLAIPFFWLLIFAVFTGVVYYDFKKTKKGYRFTAPVVLSAVVISSILLGGAGYVFGMGKKIDDILGQKAPFYSQLINPRLNMWQKPEKGRLAGLVVSDPGIDRLIIVDRSGKEWILIISDVRTIKFPIRKGLPLRAMGDKISENEFRAYELFPVGPGNGFYQKLRPGAHGGPRGMMFKIQSRMEEKI